MRIVGLSGSLRSGSYNTALLRAMAARAPEEVQVEVLTLHGIPVYDGDVEAEGMPGAVERLKERIAGADALLIASPEYNNGVPGPLKNAIDWTTRPPKDMARVWTNRTVGLVGATPGRGGTRFAQQAWLQTLRYLGTRLYTGGALYLDGAGRAFDGGELVDEKIAELVQRYVDGLVAFVREGR